MQARRSLQRARAVLKANEAFKQRARTVQAVVHAEGGADVPLLGLGGRKLDGGV